VTQPLRVTVNGREAIIETLPGDTLLDALRRAGVTETKLGCGEGVCGACCVLLDDEPVSSCLILVEQADGARITTVRGLTRGADALHPLQDAFLDHAAAQCGFCTPGMLLTAWWFVERQPDASRDEIRSALSGNLCRCTGYTRILDAVEAYRDARGAYR
jgi:aerobic carbon-monoxide dehydrogenase small subunit